MISAGRKPDDNGQWRARPPSSAALPATAAHEIYNPLDSLLNLLYLLETEATLTDEGRHYLALAQGEVRRIAQIAHQALDQANLVVMPERTNVSELLDDVLDLYKKRFDYSGITVQTRYGSDGHLPVFPDQLRQVFSNLLLNAADAMPEGGNIQARVAGAHEWSGKRRAGVRVTIADNGSGIPSNVRAQFSQQSITTKTAGHGIGLSVVRNIVRKHRGLLRVRSSTKPGRNGTVFTLFLPA